MSGLQERIFPAKLPWPSGVADVRSVTRDSTRLRLINKATGFDNLLELKSLEALWCFGINQEKLEQIAACPTLKELYCEYHLRISDVSCLKKLPRLEVLRLDSCSTITSFEQVGEFTHLQGLGLENFKNVHEIRPLSKLTNLKELAIEGSIWTQMKIDSLAPLANLRGLERLCLKSLKVADESLAPLANLKNLKRLSLANVYPLEEFAKLAAELPNTECQWFSAYVSTTLHCEYCHDGKRVLLTGKRKSLLCPLCDAGSLERHVAQFERVRMTHSGNN